MQVRILPQSLIKAIMKNQNTFKQGIEPTKQANTGFQPTKPNVMKETIGRDAGEHTRRTIPSFPDDLRIAHNPHIFWGRALELAERKGVRK